MELRANLTSPRSQQGFTIIELMIVLAVISVLAVIAVPTYMNYTGRAKVTEGLMLAGGLKQRYAEYNYFNGGWPSSNEELDLPAHGSEWGEFVDTMAVTVWPGPSVVAASTPAHRGGSPAARTGAG